MIWGGTLFLCWDQMEGKGSFHGTHHWQTWRNNKDLKIMDQELSSLGLKINPWASEKVWLVLIHQSSADMMPRPVFNVWSSRPPLLSLDYRKWCHCYLKSNNHPEVWLLSGFNACTNNNKHATPMKSSCHHGRLKTATNLDENQIFVNI